MDIRVVKGCQCTLSFWHDRNGGDRWKKDDWRKMTRQETLKPGQVIEALRVIPSASDAGRCSIEVPFMADMANSYLDVLQNCIENLEAPAAKTKGRSNTPSEGMR